MSYSIIGRYEGKIIAKVEVDNLDEAVEKIEKSFNLWYPRYTDENNGHYNFRIPKGLKFEDLSLSYARVGYGYSNMSTYGKEKPLI